VKKRQRLRLKAKGTSSPHRPAVVISTFNLPAGKTIRSGSSMATTLRAEAAAEAFE